MTTSKQQAETTAQAEAQTTQSTSGQSASGQSASGQSASGQHWTFLTNHSHVLILLAREPDLRLRDVAERVGITERAVQRIVADLEEAAILTRSRDGRRNHYEVHPAQPLRHAIEGHRTVGDLLKIVETE